MQTAITLLIIHEDLRNNDWTKHSAIGIGCGIILFIIDALCVLSTRQLKDDDMLF